jgi:predicted  nucleic acid-binding Zn-ribbon protein
MEPLLLESKALRTRLDSLEESLVSCRSSLEKSKNDRSFHNYIINSTCDNLALLKKYDIIPSLEEYKKLKKDLALAQERVKNLTLEINRLEKVIKEITTSLARVKKRYYEIKTILKSKKVLIFRRRSE